MSTIALCLIVKGTNEEALLLDKCLESLSPYVDKIFITRTQKNAAVANVATKYNAALSDFKWVDDFAVARNFNFSQVPKEYEWIMWSDADDVWRGLDKLKPTLEKNPHMDGFGFWYLYEWDEFKKPVVIHRKTMIIKNDGCAIWEGAIHEDLQPTRSLDVKLIEGIERLHVTTQTRATDNAKRNLRIAQKEVQLKEDDPRSYWNLANAQFGISNFEGARETFIKFIDSSESNEEVYLARTRLANVYKALNQRSECIKELQTAIGLFPAIPDAYLQLASYYYDFDNMDKAEEYCLQGMVKRPQIMKMVVYNPRDYDYNPLMLLAKVYERKHRPDLMLPLIKGCLKIYPDDKMLKLYVKEAEKDKEMLAKALIKLKVLQKIKSKEKLRKELDLLPEDLRSHPQIVSLRNQNFIKQTSSGRDLVIYCGNTMHEWYPGSKMGGSEEAVVNLAREWATLGWNVTVYNNCGHKEIKSVFPIKDWSKVGVDDKGYVVYKPFWEFNLRDKQDVVILWRWAKPLDADINAPKIFLDLHDVVPDGEFTPKRMEKVTKVFVKTKFHRSLFPSIPDEKIAIVPNGLDIFPDTKIKKDPYLIINTSSPDRSMDVMPELFKEIKKQVPKAKMKWAYGWEGFVNTYQNDTKKMQWMEETKKAMKEAGIEDLGRISQEEVGKLYQQASIFAYPTEFAEIDCISMKKAIVAGNAIVATDFGALKEWEQAAFGIWVHSRKNKDNWNRPYQFHFGLEGDALKKEFVKACIFYLGMGKEKATFIDREAEQKWGVQFEWPKIAQIWNKELI